MEDGNMNNKKRILVNAGVSGLKPGEKPARAHAVEAACKTSAAYQASPQCQATMASWLIAADALGENQKQQAKLTADLKALVKDEGDLVVDYDTGAEAFAVAVQAATKGNPTIAAQMNMAIRADPTPLTQVVVPEGVRITTIRTTGGRMLSWNIVPGAKMYVAEMSTTPATETSWTRLLGRGKRRTLPHLVPGQAYTFRVCAVGHDGTHTDWSVVLSFTA
jgi:hypothetical protein